METTGKFNAVWRPHAVSWGGNTMRATSVLFCWLACYVTSLAKEPPAPVEVVLGGPRQVKASLVTEKDEIQVSISMIGVRCFDPLTNDRLNREKARSYAIQALATHLKEVEKNKKTVIQLRGGHVTEAKHHGKRYQLTFAIPVNGVSLEPIQSLKKVQPDSPDSSLLITAETSTDLFTAVSDHTTTLSLLTKSVAAELPPLPRTAEQEKGFLQALNDQEESGLRNFKELRQVVRDDKYLLKMELNDLLGLIDQQEKAFLTRLRVHVTSYKLPITEKE